MQFSRDFENVPFNSQVLVPWLYLIRSWRDLFGDWHGIITARTVLLTKFSKNATAVYFATHCRIGPLAQYARLTFRRRTSPQHYQLNLSIFKSRWKNLSDDFMMMSVRIAEISLLAIWRLWTIANKHGGRHGKDPNITSYIFKICTRDICSVATARLAGSRLALAAAKV